MGDPVCHLHMLDEEGRMPEPLVKLRRVYDPPPTEPRTGATVLVDRLWPRGIRKQDLAADRWLPELAPSDELRRWFGHRPERWEEFRRRYREELRQPERSRLLDELTRLARHEPLTLLFGAKDRGRNQAVVIMEAIEDRLAP
ncbi:MAG TPA: DUF488 family protein [Candidatus Dormibacteraeota bacterium]|nr:DUF488 family protein [Candidatus Dormibacteraeota bacterium]